VQACLYLNTCTVVIVYLVIDGRGLRDRLMRRQRDGLESELSVVEGPVSLLSP